MCLAMLCHHTSPRLSSCASGRAGSKLGARKPFTGACTARRHNVHECASAEAPLAQRLASAALGGMLSLSILASGASARPEGVNRPELLPKGEVTPVIDVAGFLAPSEEKKLRAEVEALERDTGFRLRVLAQNYPETPGLAVRDYWQVDDKSIVFVADPTFNMLNFNVGQAVDLEVPQSFWTRLAGKYGTKFYLKEKGEAAAIVNSVSAIDSCLREEPGRFKCSKVQEEFDAGM